MAARSFQDYLKAPPPMYLIHPTVRNRRELVHVEEDGQRIYRDIPRLNADGTPMDTQEKQTACRRPYGVRLKNNHYVYEADTNRPLNAMVDPVRKHNRRINLNGSDVTVPGFAGPSVSTVKFYVEFAGHWLPIPDGKVATCIPIHVRNQAYECLDNIHADGWEIDEDGQQTPVGNSYTFEECVIRADHGPMSGLRFLATARTSVWRP